MALAAMFFVVGALGSLLELDIKNCAILNPIYTKTLLVESC